MKTVIIHLGTHKAASTTVQLYLDHNREALREAGICYPLAPPPTSFAHHGMAWSVIQRYTELRRRPGNFSLADALKQFEGSVELLEGVEGVEGVGGADGAESADSVEGAEEKLSECSTLLLSSEDFLTTSFYDGFLEEFFAELRETFDRVIVCAYVRSRKDFFTSSYNQWIKSLSYSKTFDVYLTQVLRGLQAPMQYTKSLGLWGEHADEAIFLPFLPKAFESTPEQHLLMRLGVSEEALQAFEPFSTAALNASIGPRAILACRRLSHSLHSTEWYEHYAHEKTELLLNELESWIEEREWNAVKFRAVEERHVKHLRELFAETDDAFAQRYLGAENWLELFPQDAGADEPTEVGYKDLNAEEKAEIDAFVRQGFRLARDIHLHDFNPVVARQQAAEAEAQVAAGRSANKSAGDEEAVAP